MKRIDRNKQIIEREDNGLSTSMTTGTLTLMIFVVILAQLAIVVMVGLYRRKRQFQDLEPHAGEPQSAAVAYPDAPAMPPRLSTSDLVWDGFKEFVVQPRVIEDGMASVCSFYLVPADAKPLPSFMPGQYLTFSIRNSIEHVMKDHLRPLAEAHPNFHLHICYSRPGTDDVEGVDYQHRGHVDLPLLRATLKLARDQFYVCGPKPMMA